MAWLVFLVRSYNESDATYVSSLWDASALGARVCCRFVADSCRHVAVLLLLSRCSAAVITLLLSLFYAPETEQNINVFSRLDGTPADGTKFRIKTVTRKAQGRGDDHEQTDQQGANDDPAARPQRAAARRRR